MSKRSFARSELGDSIDLDKVLRPRRHQRSVEGASDSITTDPDNLMDNWYLSALEIRRQRDSKDLRDRAFWLARKSLDPGQVEIKGSWRYYRNRDQKSWKQTGLTRRARDAFGSSIKFPAYGEDIEFSDTYRLWLEGRKLEFLNTLYTHYAVGNFIPEEVIWRLFRCLASELIPKSESWDDAPEYLVESPNTIWQIGKCVFQTITRGRFWSEEYNALSPVDNGEKFGEYKQKVLQKHYSKNLMKYVLACVSADPTKRYFRSELLEHIEKVLSVFEGTYQPAHFDESFLSPYTPTNQLIPYDLTREEGEVYEALLEIVEERKKHAGDGKQRIPRIVVVTDLAKDYDDLLAMMCLKELHRLGVVHIEGFVANLMPPDRRALFGRGALDSLGYPDIKIAVGTIGDSKRALDQHSHEFDNTEDFMATPDRLKDLPDGQELMKEIFTDAVEKKYGITILTISSLMDLAKFAEDHGELLKKGLSNVVLQGGYRIIKGRLTADFAAQNNKFDEEGATVFHEFMQDNNIPSCAWTKVAAQAVPIYNTLFEYLDQTRHPLGPYLRKVQVTQDLNFYERACSDHPYAPYMTQDWYVGTKSTWFAAGHEPDEPYPMGEDMIPYFTKVVAYDALAAVGSSGQDVLDKFGIVKPIVKRQDVDDETHRLVGIPAVKETEDQPGLPQEENFDADKMGLVITALLKGSILAKQQRL
ncbi:uncharacterized protein LY89DRAFT_784773 [Mollisia scopiformis]|uniref:Inosine/uridine-preferring nucleoside hydrolase domain-containing protein n=1 Tax=Mollisia scopiformis TaxID=149040 RepID=A0A194X277_MOLSC|nr:uncharacterized protein LY89DRAFT_784773 [Mollisia scopiformis]KUJ13937.1 hypothetical protein LY89DRAFT_784773 [Mollisia scopiformis]